MGDWFIALAALLSSADARCLAAPGLMKKDREVFFSEQLGGRIGEALDPHDSLLSNPIERDGDGERDGKAFAWVVEGPWPLKLVALPFIASPHRDIPNSSPAQACF